MTEAERAWSKARYEEYKKAYAALMLYYPFTLENLPGEMWKDIPDYDGDYQESNFGRTKSFKNGKEKILKPYITPKGYLGVGLFKEAKGKKKYIHRLVAELFIPNPENKPQINHIDGCKLNNHFENLEYLTDKENLDHAVKLGLIKSGENNYQAKLTAEQVREIRKLYVKGSSEFGYDGLAKLYGVGRVTIQRVVNYERYKNVE